MAVNDSTDAMAALSVNDDRWKELGLDDIIQTQLIKIENGYESIFSWSIQRLTGSNQNLRFSLVDKVRGKQEMITYVDGCKNDEFNLNRFYLQLVASYELYNSKRYEESYLEIGNVVKFMETCKFDESNEQYSSAYHHIARATNAYIAFTLKIDAEKLLNDIKQINNFNRAEKAAICAVKGRVFMEYAPKGNDIALEFASRARNLYSAEHEWIIIWLKAKGRVRRYYQPYTMAGNDEMDAAKTLCSTTLKSHILIEVSQLYKETGFVYKMKNNYSESNKYYKLASDIAKKSVELAKDDTRQLCFILMICIENPKLLSKSIIDNLITKLTNVKNSRVDQVLGLYYLKHEKDYAKAKIHLYRGKAAGQFNTALQLIEVECLLQSVKTFPYVNTLNMMYDDFPNPVRRLIILKHLLIYYNYCEKNPKEMMRYLKLYIDQDVDDTIKKRHLTYTRPLFYVDTYDKPNEFMNVLSKNVEDLINYKWSIEEKQTIDCFNKILKLNSDDDKFNDSNKTTINKKNESWRKQRIDLSENRSNESYQQKNESWRKQRNPRYE
ncbi:uncharacterized protein LOC100165115 [Acyrthosiphon pisum]|uniref:Uncharacterized protein n=1 Tax=Acyrthosiphon pisum TaxID=7029 RepID=A0A8R1W0H4_ACYPI|nr:uncharacterized protein LOC100165115 [Acyrthosiphon pisum]XP_008179979.1 uncharacterized protein LOC100165115 [Acyrthosiphon pisum]XP_016657443.1 uncharacterized protein LOC100165115 [Acyrthosiphon pisum]|eukprot:XP_001946582.1 PREDICTED: uncharacterized protein LOC100165115 [Acyrthosiphon pisum]